MLAAILLLLIGTAVLILGAEAAIRGAGRFAIAHGLSAFVLGALLFGVDIESLGAALVAAGRGQASIAVGEALGTIVFLYSIGFGTALLLARRPVQSPSGLMVLLPGGSLILGAIAISDQEITRPEGLVLVGAYLFYITVVVLEGRAARLKAEQIVKEASEAPAIPPSVLLVGGLILVYVGATALVSGGVRLLERSSLAAGFVGAAIIGALASADEVLLEVVPVLRGLPELATGNLFGTMAAFTTGALGLAALVRPLMADSAANSAYLAAAVLYSIVSVAFLARGQAGRLVGALLLVTYATWLVLASRL